jgi:hypothetical protein
MPQADGLPNARSAEIDRNFVDEAERAQKQKRRLIVPMIRPLLAIALSIAFVCWGLYGFVVYALPLLFDLGWQSTTDPQILVVRLLAWLGGMIFLGIWGAVFFGIWGAGLIVDLLHDK